MIILKRPLCSKNRKLCLVVPIAICNVSQVSFPVLDIGRVMSHFVIVISLFPSSSSFFVQYSQQDHCNFTIFIVLFLDYTETDNGE